jgi:predicted MPP superfamily phosphohydrolase
MISTLNTSQIGRSAGFLSIDEVMEVLERRLGRLHARQRLGIEAEHEAQVFGQGLNFFHPENFPGSHVIIETILRLSGAYWRGRSNAAKVELRTHDVISARLPSAFDGYSILHLSDLHTDMSAPAMKRVAELLAGLRYDLCVLTGDYRGLTYGPYHPALEGLAELRQALSGDVYGVLGNHDTILMVPDLERMGIKMLLNEHVMIERGDAHVFLTGIDDAHFYRVDNIEKAAAEIPQEAFSILLSHTPEIFRQASHAGFDLMLSGHTHGGQICLPGGIPVTLDSNLPRRMGRGAWKHHDMVGYTSAGAGSSVVPARFNCLPEITVHTLRKLR